MPALQPPHNRLSRHVHAAEGHASVKLVIKEESSILFPSAAVSHWCSRAALGC